MRIGARTLVAVALIVGLSTAVAVLVRPFRGEASGALVFVIGITIAGARFGLLAALVTAAASFLLYNFYFAEPVLELRLTSVSDFAPLVIFNVSAIIAGLIAGRVRDEAEASAAANVSLVTLLQVTEALQAAIGVADIRRALSSPAAAEAGIRLLPRSASPGGIEADNAAPLPKARVSEVALLEGADAFPAARIECGAERIELAIVPAGLRPEAQAAFASAIANMVGLALERATLSGRVVEAEALARLETLKSALLSSVSHDLRTPLTTISASASTIIQYRDQLARPVEDELLTTIVDESDRLNRLTGNLLEMTKLESGQPLKMDVVSVADVVNSAVRRIGPRLGTRRVDFAHHADCTVLADPSLFEIVIMNVLENAILYSPVATRIEIGLIHCEGVCRLTVADEGCGVPADELERIFERFHRVENALHAPRGTGLGLAIAKGFVSACGGQILAAVPGIGERGTRVTISLPLARPEVG